MWVPLWILYPMAALAGLAVGMVIHAFISRD